MSRYLCTQNDPFPDVCAFNIEDFKYNEQPIKYRLNQADILRFDLLIAKFYTKMEYADIVLYLNNIDHRDHLAVGDILVFPATSDIERFLFENRK